MDPYNYGYRRYSNPYRIHRIDEPRNEVYYCSMTLSSAQAEDERRPALLIRWINSLF